MDSVTVRLPALLADMEGGPRTSIVSGSTVEEAVGDLVRQRPALALHLFDESGAMRGNILWSVGSVCQRGRKGLAMPVRPGDTITILNSVSGG